MPLHSRIYRLLASATLVLTASAFLPAQEMELIPNGLVTFDENTGEVIATDGAQILYDNWILFADTIRFNQETGEANAIGNVVFSRFDLRLIADTLVYRPSDQYVNVTNFRVGNGRVYLDGSELEGNPNNFKFNDVNFYPGEPGTFLFEARAGEVALVDGNEVRGKKLFFKVGPIPFLLIPNITQPLDAETNLFRPTLDYSGHIGAAIGAEALAPITDNLRLGGNIALTTKRGVLFGPAARYAEKNANYEVSGTFISGYIKDQGDPEQDVLGNNIDDQRYFADWQHQQFWKGNRANLSTYVRYWSDSEVTRDFNEGSFDRMQDPDSYLEANYNGDNWQLSLFTRAGINDFQSFTERLPELKLTLFPTTIKKGLTHQGFLSAARLDSSDENQNAIDGATRLDAYYGWNYNTSLRDGVTLGLKAGARGSRYDDATVILGYPVTSTPSGPSFDLNNPYTADYEGERAFGEIGLDLNFKAYSEHEFKNKTWNITGIRHIIEPRISYRYTPEINTGYNQNTGVVLLPNGGIGSNYLYQGIGFDRLTFGNFQSPIDIENRRDVDSIFEDHKIRLEVRNRIQTRHRDGGSRDLARFTIANDYYLSDSSYGENGDFSLIYGDVTVTPADWIEGGLYTRLDPDDGLDVREFNARISIQDKGYWKIGGGVHFLDGYSNSPSSPFQSIPYGINPFNTIGVQRLEQYYAFLEYNLNENLKLYATTRYDDESGVFYEQRIGLMQRALERYGLKYEIRIYDGARRETDFGVSIGIDLFE